MGPDVLDYICSHNIWSIAELCWSQDPVFSDSELERILGEANLGQWQGARMLRLGRRVE